MRSQCSSFFNHARKLRDFIINLLFPLECLGCQKEALWLCSDCKKKISFNTFNYCQGCKIKNKFGEYCPNCSSDYFINGIWVAGNYDNKIIVKLIKNFKYKFAENISYILGDYLSRYLLNLLNNYRLIKNDINNGGIWQRLDIIKNAPLLILDFQKTILMPVPLHKKRKRFRGFNQSEKLAFIIKDNFNLEINNDLSRIKYTKAQAKLKEKDRKTNVLNSFSYNGKNLSGKNILLIDDVVTTGSTLNECAKILKQHNAGEVWGLVVAKG